MICRLAVHDTWRAPKVAILQSTVLPTILTNMFSQSIGHFIIFYLITDKKNHKVINLLLFSRLLHSHDPKKKRLMHSRAIAREIYSLMR